MTETNITPFLFEGESLVRVTHVDGQPMFVAADVCRILGIQQATRAVENLDDDEKGVSSIHTPGGPQDVLVVTESGLYALIFRSRKPAAVRFRKWVTGEVLPSIRKTGSYGSEGGALKFEETQASRTFGRRTATEWVAACRVLDKYEQMFPGNPDVIRWAAQEICGMEMPPVHVLDRARQGNLFGGEG